MLALMNWRLWAAVALAVGLAISHGMAYKTGRAVVRVEWGKDIEERNAQTLKAEQEARAKEHALQTAKQKVEVNYAAQKKRDAVALSHAQSELDQLRVTLSAVNSSTGQDTSTTARADGAGRLERELLGNCAQSLTDLAREADRLETKLVGLQGYVRDVCKRD